MATLTGKLVADTYKALLKLIDNDVITGSEKQISDGVGGSTGVFIDTNGFLRASKYKVTGATSTQFLKGNGTLDSTAYLPVGTTTTNVPEGTNLYFTQTRVLNTLLTGFLPVTGSVSATDTVLTALNKIWWNIVNGGGGGGGGYVPYIGALQSVDLGEWGIKADYLEVAETPVEAVDARKIVWNSIDGTFDMGLLNGVTLQAGQEINFYGKATEPIANGEAVMFAGSQGDHLLIAQADPAAINANPEYFIGVATQDFTTNEFGYVTVFGKVRQLNTSSFTLSNILWFNSGGIIPGALTTAEPIAPNVKIRVAAVVRVHHTQGSIMVRPDIAPKLLNLSDVYVDDIQDKDITIWDEANLRWKNENVFASINATEVGKSFLSIPDADDVVPVPTKARWTRINTDNTVSAIEALDMGYIPYFRDTELFAKSPIYTTGAIVGIGTASPTALLHLKGTTAYTELKLDNNGPTGGGMFIALQNGVQTAMFGADAYYQANTSKDAAIIAKQATAGIQFYTNGSQSEKMGINADGNVFVGQTPTWLSSAVNFIVRGKTGAGHIGVMHYDMSIKGIFNTFNSVVQIGSSTFHSVAIMVENSEKARVNSSGRLLWGTTIDNGVDIAQFNGSIVATAIKKSGGTSSQYLMADGSVSAGNAGTVTSVAASVPTGFDIAGSPITSSGTLAITFAAGYSLPTTAKQTQWDTAYANRITSASLPLSITSNVISIAKADSLTDGYLSGADWATFNAKQSALSGVGFVKVVGSTISYDNTSYTPTSRLLTINGTSYDLTSDRSWTITPGSGMRNVQSFTATSGQTTFAVTGGYTVNLVDVYVNGARLSSADFTATNGTSVVLATGVVTNDIVEIIAYTASLSSGINGSGTTGYVPKFTSSNTLADSLIFSNSTNVGIGTASPSATLHVIGTALISGAITANSFVKSGGTASQILAADGSVITAGTNVTISGGVISATGGGGSGSGTTNYVAKWTNSSTLGNSILFDNGTKVGIGTTSPGEKLDIYSGASSAAFINLIGNANAAGTSCVVIGQNSDDGAYFWNRKSSYLSLGTNNTERIRILPTGDFQLPWATVVNIMNYDNSYRMGYLYNVNSRLFTIFSAGNDGDPSITFNTRLGAGSSSTDYGTEKMRISGIGNVGIGTSTPSFKLHVVGDIRTKMVHFNANSENRGHRIYSRTMDVNAYTTATNMRFTVAAGNNVQFQYEIVFHATRTTSGNLAEIWYLRYTAGIAYDTAGNPNERWWTYREQDGNGIAGIGRNNQNGYFEIQNTAFDSGCRLTCFVKITCNNWDAVTVTYP